MDYNIEFIYTSKCFSKKMQSHKIAHQHQKPN